MTRQPKPPYKYADPRPPMPPIVEDADRAGVRDSNLKFMAAALACPHDWGEPKPTTVVDQDGSKRKGDVSTCSRCGCHRAKWADGTGSLFSGAALSAAPPAGKKKKPAAPGDAAG